MVYVEGLPQIKMIYNRLSKYKHPIIDLFLMNHQFNSMKFKFNIQLYFYFIFIRNYLSLLIFLINKN